LDWFVGKEGSAMDITKGQKILVASYLAYIVLFYALLILEVEPVIKYADTIELVGFVLAIILMSVGIKKHSPERRLAWKLFLAAIVAYGIGDLIWAYYVTFLGVDPNSAPSICDAFYLVNTIIYCAGLDLGYPKLQSHIRGSLFEELSHRTSNKLNPAEKNLSISLFTSNSSTAYDYSGEKIFTDEKMKMFAWWFESQTQKYPDVKSYSLSKKSYAIPGFEYCSDEALLKLPENTELKSQFFIAEQDNNDKTKENSLIRFNKAFNSLITGFTELYALAKKGFKIADTMLTNFNTANISKGINELEDIDDKILHSQFTHSASLVFPTENKLNQIFNKIDFPEDTAKTVFIKSKIIYSELQKSIAEYQKYLSQI